MDRISFTIYAEPIAQQRPKFFRRGNFVGAYDPKESKQAKKDFKLQALTYKPEKLIIEPINLQLEFYKQRPKTLPKKVKYHIKRPDLDNMIKLVKDSLTGLFWRDDSQIISLQAIKKYCENGDIPRTNIIIEVVDT